MATATMKKKSHKKYVSKSNGSKISSKSSNGHSPNYANPSSPWSYNPWTMNNSAPFVAGSTPTTQAGWTNPYLVDSVNRVFEEMTRSWESGAPWTPRCDFWETSTGYTIRCCVPGCTKSDCKIECTTNSITISGNCNLSNCPSDCNCYCCECQTGNFSRYFNFPNPINTDWVKASCKNGVLTVTCRKSSKNKPTTVKVG